MEYGTKRWKKHNAIRTAYVDKEGELFFGTDGGILVYNPQKDRFENFDAKGKIQFKKGVFEIMQDNQCYYWFAEIDKGLWKWHPITGETQTYNKDSISGLSSTNLKVLHQTSNGDIWVGSHMNGLCKLPVGQKKYISYTHSDQSGSLSNNRVYAIFEDSKNHLWIGTGDGLSRYKKEQDSFEVFGVNNGLPGKVILSIQEDSLGRLWLGTNKGLSCFDVEKQQFANFYQEDGLQGNIFEYKVACTHTSGKLFFGGNNGLNAFYPLDFKMNTFTPHLQFVKVSSSLGMVDVYRVNQNPEIRIKNSEKNVIIELASDSYVETYKNNYSYRLVPQDSIWMLLPFSHHQIELPALAVGNYTLEVHVSNNHMKWNPKVSQLHIDVSRDWAHESGLLYGVLITIALTLLAWLSWSKRKARQGLSVKKQKKNKKESKKEPLVRPSDKDKEEWAAAITQLNNFMMEHHYYRDKRLTKGQLANQVGWTEAQLSNTLREGLQTNFNDFVNAFRVAEIKERLKDPQSRDFTLLAIAEECGFNSKTSFYRIFKKLTNLTPSEYLERINQED